MLHLMKYSFLTKIKNASVVFWPLVFPIILATLMYFAIGQMDEADFETVPVAVVEKEGSRDEPFTEFLHSVEDSTGVIRVEEMTEGEALEALEKQDAAGIYYIGESPSLTVGGSGLPESILQMLLEGYFEGKQTMEDLSAAFPEGEAAAAGKMREYTAAVEQVSLGGETTNGNAQFFYALIGMACLYGCFLGYGSAMDMQANLTALAARRCAGPIPRLKLILSEAAVCFGLHFLNMLLLLAYMKYILKQDFAGDYAGMLPILAVGSITGVVMGMFITSIGKMKEGVKIGMMLAVSMTCSFLAGMMNAEMKYVVDQYAPFINRLNPAALISDALYCLNVYDAPARYAQDIAVLCVICAVLAAGTFLIVRRERYVSI